MERVRQYRRKVDAEIQKYEDICRRMDIGGMNYEGERVDASMPEGSKLEAIQVEKKLQEEKVEEMILRLDAKKEELTQIIKGMKLGRPYELICLMYYVDCRTNTQIARFFKKTKRWIIRKKGEAKSRIACISPPDIVL